MPIMRAFSATYKFSQRLPVPARQAYLWCTDYKPNDLSLMNMKGLRKIEKISSDTIILRELVDRGKKKIKKWNSSNCTLLRCLGITFRFLAQTNTQSFSTKL